MPGRLRELRGEGGFMLMEMLMATLIGMVVFLALLSLVDASQNSTARVTNRVDGTQRGRAAMEQVTQRLRSQTCITSTPPIISGTTSEVSFYSDLGTGLDFQPEQRRIFISGSQLKEDVYDSSGSFPTFTFPATPSKTRVIATGIRQAKDASGNPIPYFSYFAYNTTSPAAIDQPVNPPFTATDPARISKVQVAFAADTPSEDQVETNFVNGVTARMADASASDTSKRGPQCS